MCDTDPFSRCVVNFMAPDALETQRAKASAAIAIIKFSRNLLNSALEGLASRIIFMIHNWFDKTRMIYSAPSCYMSQRWFNLIYKIPLDNTYIRKNFLQIHMMLFMKLSIFCCATAFLLVIRGIYPRVDSLVSFYSLLNISVIIRASTLKFL